MIILVFLIAIFYGPANALSVGSKSVVSAQGAVTFPSSDTNNQIVGYAAFENGFRLEDNTTTCTFDNFLPVSGEVYFNGGLFYLQEDLTFGNTSEIITGGRIYGNNRVIQFRNAVASQTIPILTNQPPYSASNVAASTMLTIVNAVDWSYDDRYIASVSNRTNSGSELYVYYFDGNSLTTTASAELDKDALSVRWHPSKYFVAVGRKNGPTTEVAVYRLNVSNGTFTVTDSRNFSAWGTAVEWHPSGNYLIVGTGGSPANECYTYSFNQTTGVLTDVVSASLQLSPSRAIQWDSVRFAPGGDRIVLGTDINTTTNAPEFLVCSFNGTAIAITTSLDLDTPVPAVDWHPTGTFIAVGLNTGNTETLRIYEHSKSPEILLRTPSANTGATTSVMRLHWHPSGNYLAVGFNGTGTATVNVYRFDKINKTLQLLQNIVTATAIYVVRWSHDGRYLCYGDSLNNVVVFSIGLVGTIIFTVDKTTLVFNADTTIGSPLFFSGSCKIDGRGKRLTLGRQGSSFIVRPNSVLTLENVELRGLGTSNLRCMMDSGSLILRDCILNIDSNFSFSRGSILLSNDNLLTGTGKFIYSTGLGSTISSMSTLYLDQGLTFSYDPRRAQPGLLYMQDATSFLYCDGCTLHTTRTGMLLDRGTFVMDGKVTISSEARNSGEALRFGSSAAVNVLGTGAIDLWGRIKID